MQVVQFCEKCEEVTNQEFVPKASGNGISTFSCLECDCKSKHLD